jgi:glucose-1-phosphate thymidylyltransferase
VSFSYIEQVQPRGLADAFILGREFVGSDSVSLILGDNIFYGTGLVERLRDAAGLQTGAKIFAYPVKDPTGYGVVEFDDQNRAVSIEEKPDKPRSRYAVPGLYFYDNQVLEMAANLKPSPRGELEITDINRIYLERSQLHVNELGRGVAWLDAGTHENLLHAANFVQAVEERQGLMISCPEEISYRMGFITKDQLRLLGENLNHNSYGDYLLQLANEE